MPLTPVPFTNTLDFSKSVSMVMPSGSGVVLLGLAKNAAQRAVAGVEVEIDIPPGACTALWFARALNVTGDFIPDDTTISGLRNSQLDTGSRYLLALVWGSNGQVYGSLRLSAAADTTGPTILAAYIPLNQRDRVVLACDTPLKVPDFQGLRLNGTSRRIVNRSLDTTSLNATFLLDGSYSTPSPSVALSLDIGADCNITDGAGNPITPQTVTVQDGLRPNALAGCLSDVWTRDATEVTLSGANVLTLIDRATGAGVFNGTGSAGLKPQWTANGDGTFRIDMTDAVSIQALQRSNGPLVFGADFSTFWLTKVTALGGGGQPSFIASGGRSSSGTWWRMDQSMGNLGEFDVDAGHPSGEGANGVALPSNTWNIIHFYRSGTKWGLKDVVTGVYNERTVEVGHPSAVLDTLTIGAFYTNGLFFNGAKMSFEAMCGFNSKQGSAVEALVRAAWQGGFTTAP